MTTLLRLVRRVVGTLLTTTFLTFFAIEISIPGGFKAVVLPSGMPESSPRAREIIDTFHLDQNLFVRYGHWVVDALQGDFGRSTRAGTPVTELITHRLPITMEIMLVGIALTIVLGIPLGLLAANWSRRTKGRFLDGFLGLSQSIPVFLTPIFLVWLFAIELRWLPAAGWVRISDSVTGNLKGMVLPMVALVFSQVGIVARIVKGDVLDVLETDYIVAAAAKGLGAYYVLLRHALRPASLGLLNVVGMNIGQLLSGAIVIEIIFGIGGLGQVFLEATLNRDVYLLLGLTTYMVVIYVLLNTLVDALMLALDPRIRPT